MPKPVQTKAAVLFISGQSNAHAHGQVMKEEDRILEPLRNVFSLDRNPNQSFDITDVVWSGYTTEGKNLGEIQDHTYSFASFAAKWWQKAIDNGAKLPDLYIVQISIGSQGIINGMWNPDRERTMIPGKLGVVNISLFPWAQQVNRLVMKNLKEAGKNPEVIGWHWFGCEQEVWYDAYARPDLQERYDTFFDAVIGSIGAPCPMYLYKVYMQVFCEKNNIPLVAGDKINAGLERQCHRFPDVTFVRAEDAPFWDWSQPHRGVYCQDNGHYHAKSQAWFAEQFLRRLPEFEKMDFDCTNLN